MIHLINNSTQHKIWNILCFMMLLVFIALTSVNAQQTTPPAPAQPPASPPPATSPTTPSSPPDNTYIRQQQNQIMREEQWRNEQIRRAEADRLRQRNEMMIMSNSLPRSVMRNVRRDVDNLYRKTNKKELKLLAVNEGDLKKYEAFLKQPKSGLVRLMPDLGCSDNQHVVVASEECLKYSMPGGGASYSFRIKDYRIPGLADLTFSDDNFQVTGKLLHGILTGIGDVPLEKVSLQNPGIKYLIDFQPANKFEDAVLIDKKLNKGINKDGFIYSRALKAIDNMTYVLRSIAYDGEYYRAVNGVTYNELDFDKRKDVIIAFKIVSRAPDKSITILWKELESKDSPKIKKPSEDKKKIGENNFVAKKQK